MQWAVRCEHLAEAAEPAAACDRRRNARSPVGTGPASERCERGERRPEMGPKGRAAKHIGRGSGSAGGRHKRPESGRADERNNQNTRNGVVRLAGTRQTRMSHSDMETQK